MPDGGVALRVHGDIAGHGTTLAVDDFGTGHSSLSYLDWIPAHEPVIDTSFMLDLDTNQAHRRIVQAAVSVGHGPGMSVAAEGVETTEVMDLLRAARCDVAQGYARSRPLPADDCYRWLASWHGRAQGTYGTPSRSAPFSALYRSRVRRRSALLPT